MPEPNDPNLVHKPSQGIVKTGKGSLISRGRELASRKTELAEVKAYRCVAWGDNDDGQCDVPAGEKFTQIAAGDSHSIGLRADGTAIAWGMNDFGQCDVPEGETFAQVAAGRRHTIGLRGDGTAIAWGSNEEGVLDVPDSEIFTQVSAGGCHIIGLVKN